MKKQLLFDIKKMSFKIAAVTALTLLTAQSSHAQKWNIIGQDNEISTSTTVSASYTTITVLGNVPYVSYVEGAASGIGKVKMKNASTGTWDQVGGDIAPNISFSRIYSDKTGKLYVTYVDNANGSRLAVAFFNTATSAWETVGGTGAFVSDGSVTHALSSYTTRADLAFDSNNVPYITYSERVGTVAAPQGAYVKRFNGTSWEGVGSSTGQITTATTTSDLLTVGNAIAIDANNVPYVVYIRQTLVGDNAGTILAFRLNALNTWEDLIIPNPVGTGTAAQTGTTGARHSNIVMDSDNNPIIGFGTTLNSNRATFLRFTKSTGVWDYLGNTGTRDSSRITVTNDAAGNVYDIFHDTLANGGRSNTVRVYKRPAGTVSNYTELVNTPITSLSGVGIDAAGANQTTAYVAPAGLSISNIAIAVGSNTNSPYIVYTKNSTNGGITTPMVRVFDPLILSTAVTAITDTGATLSGEVLATAPAVGTITERGVVYGTTVNPTTANTKIAEGATTAGVFTSPVSGLTANTAYYTRAYFIYSDGVTTYTVYGDNKRFTTAAALGIDSFEKSDAVKAYPNPTTDTVTVSLPNGVAVEKIAVYNNLGQLVLTEAKNTVSLQQLNNGTYFLTIYTAEGNFSKKIIKK